MRGWISRRQRRSAGRSGSRCASRRAGGAGVLPDLDRRCLTGSAERPELPCPISDHPAANSVKNLPLAGAIRCHTASLTTSVDPRWPTLTRCDAL